MLLLQALLAVRPELRAAGEWKQRVQQVHDTWANKLYIRDRDMTPGKWLYKVTQRWQLANDGSMLMTWRPWCWALV